MKRTIFTLFVLLFSYSLFASDFTVNGIAYLIGAGKTVAVTSGGNYTGSITIPSSVTYGGTTYSVTSIGSNAFNDRTGLTSVTILGSITSIADNAFFCCSSLTSNTLPSSVTSIGSSAFYECYRLKSINLPDALESIGDQAFRYCTS